MCPVPTQVLVLTTVQLRGGCQQLLTSAESGVEPKQMAGSVLTCWDVSSAESPYVLFYELGLGLRQPSVTALVSTAAVTVCYSSDCRDASHLSQASRSRALLPVMTQGRVCLSPTPAFSGSAPAHPSLLSICPKPSSAFLDLPWPSSPFWRPFSRKNPIFMGRLPVGVCFQKSPSLKKNEFGGSTHSRITQS